MGVKFKWDGAKARSNYAKHGVSFQLATEVFKDFFAVEFIDDRGRYSETRFVIAGMVEGTLLWVVYTERGGCIRIISARRATKNEQDDYFRQNFKTDDSRRN